MDASGNWYKANNCSKTTPQTTKGTLPIVQSHRTPKRGLTALFRNNKDSKLILLA